MKKVFVIALILSSPMVLAKEISIKVSGMVCSMCAQGIEKKFSNLLEVQKVKVDLDSKFVSITTKDDSDIPDSKITELITEAGYNVASIERK